MQCLTVEIRMLWNCLPDSSGVNSPWEGWEGSATMVVAWKMHCLLYSSVSGGRGAPVIFSAVHTIQWRDMRSVVYEQKMLSIVPLQNMIRKGGGRLAFFSLHRTWRCCWAILVMLVVLSVHVKSSAICTLNNFMLLTILTAELLWSGIGVAGFHLKSTTISFVFLTFRDRLLSWYHSCCLTSFLSLLRMSPDTVLSFANLIMWFERSLAVQTCIRRVTAVGWAHNLRGTSAQSDDPGGVVAWADRLWPVSEEIQDPVTEWSVYAQDAHLPSQNDCIYIKKNIYRLNIKYFVIVLYSIDYRLKRICIITTCFCLYFPNFFEFGAIQVSLSMIL